MARYAGEGIRVFAEQIKDEAPKGIRDWSIDLAYHLAMALVCLHKLQDAEIQTSFKRKRLILPSLEDAWRQLILIRQRFVSDDFALNDIIRRVTLSRTGKVMIDEDQELTASGKPRMYRRPNSPKYKHRVIRKPTEQ